MVPFKDLSELLDPQSIAIVGATPKSNAWPARIWANLQRFKFPGKIYPVNPRYDSLWEQKSYPTLDDLPEVVDNALLIVPAPQVIKVLKECKLNKFRSATILSGGFGEGNDKEGLERKMFVQNFARETGIRFSGPNCMGLVSTKQGTVLYPDLRMPPLKVGGLAVVSQSGGLMGALIRTFLARGMGIRYFVSSGNEIDADLADYLNHFLINEETRAVAAIVEGIKDAERFAVVARNALSTKIPILILKIGRSPKGKSATLAHTGTLAGDDQLFEALCQEYGLVNVRNLDEMLNTAEFFLRLHKLPTGKKAAFLTFSGGLNGVISDIAYDVDLDLPDLHPTTYDTLSGLLGVGTCIGNPLDTGWSGLSSQETYLKCIKCILDDSAVDMLAIQEELPRSNIRLDKESNLLALADIAKVHPKPISVFSMSTQGTNEYGIDFKQRCDLPFLEEIRNTVLALKHIGNFGVAVKEMDERLCDKKSNLPSSLSKGINLIKGKNILNEWESYQVLSQIHLPIANFVFVTNVGEVVKSAANIGYPVVLKIVVPAVTHKTELGGVLVNLKNSQELEEAIHRMETEFKKSSPESMPEGFIVQEMVQGSVETIIGAVNDPLYGPTVMFGIGGEFVEVYNDVVFRIAPVNQKKALEMLYDIKGFPLLTGFRKRPAVDLLSLASAVVLISELIVAEKEWIQSIDINPFIPLELGGKAVDAVIIMRKKGI